MAWTNANRAMKVHVYYSFWLSVEKRKILLDRCNEGWHHCIGIQISDNIIEEESITASSICTEKRGK